MISLDIGCYGFAGGARRNHTDFIDYALEESGLFPIQRYQTNRGRKLFTKKVQKSSWNMGLSLVLTNQGRPTWTGKLNDLKKTDEAEFYATVNLDDPALSQELAFLQQHCNWERPHRDHVKPPMGRYFGFIDQIPLTEEALWQAPSILDT